MPEETTQAPVEPQDGSTTSAPQDEATETSVQETFDREYVEKLRKEAASYRTRAKELEAQNEEAKKAAERAKMDEVEAAKAEATELREALEAARHEAQRATWKAGLTGKVVNPDAALKLLDPEKHMTDDGNVDVDALLSEYDFLAPQSQGRSPVSPANTASSKQGPLTAQDFRGKSREWIRENLHRLKSN